MPQQLCIVVHPVEMGGAIVLQTYTVSGNQTIKATHAYFIEGGEFLMQRMPREGSEGDSGSRIQRSLNHANLEAQRKVVNSTPTIRHKFVMLLYYTSNFNVCWMTSWFQMKCFWLQSTFYTQFSVKSRNTVIFTVKWTRYFWARSYSGWVLSSYFFKNMLNWFESWILSLLMQCEPIFSYKYFHTIC